MEYLKINVTNELTNKKLASGINAINKAIETIGKNTWTVADKLSDIVTKEYFKDDFETIENFSTHLGMSKSNVSRLCRASQLHADRGMLANWSVSAVIELLPLPEKELDISILNLGDCPTVKEVRELVKRFSKMNEETADADAQEETADADAQEETADADAQEETADADVLDKDDLRCAKTIKVDGIEYSVDDEFINALVELLNTRKQMEGGK